MKIKMSTDNICESERLVLLLIIGITTAMKEKIMSVEEAENLLFSPYSVKKLAGLDDSVLNLIKLGCELEDIESLLPENLPFSIEEIYNQSVKKLSYYQKRQIPIKKWLD